MKILLLNPHIDAGHKIVAALQTTGAGVLLASTAEEAWQMLQLHGKSIDLAVIHREGFLDPEDGLKLVDRIKADSSQGDLPFVVSSAEWGDAEFAAHQGTAQGANAYLRWPFDEQALMGLISSLFGDALASATKSQITSPAAPGGTGIVLEEASSIFNTPSPSSATSDADLMFSLDAPDLDAAEPEPAARAVPPPLVVEATVPVEKSGSFPTLAVPSASAAPAAPGPGVPPPPPPASGTLASIDLNKIEDPRNDPSLQFTSVPVQPQEPQGPVLDLTSSRLGPPTNSGFSIAPELTGVRDTPAPAEPSGPMLNPIESSRIDIGSVAETAGSPEAPLDEQELASEMPYLFSSKKTDAQKGGPEQSPSMVFAQPVGDAVVPGGAAHSPDVDTLKRYLLLREQDVAVLSTQLSAAQEQVRALENQLKSERGQNTELSRTIDDQKRTIEEFEKEKSIAIGNMQAEIDDLRFQVKAKTDKARVLEAQVREAAQEIERLKERVRSDIRKIRVREKELENRLEIVKKDSEALIAARENKIIELKRKIDILEFNMDLLQDQYSREKEISAKLRERLAKAAQVVRVAGGLLDATASAAGATAPGSGTAKTETESTDSGEEKAS